MSKRSDDTSSATLTTYPPVEAELLSNPGRPSFRYLLINHVPFGKGPGPGLYRIGAMWLEDLRAQAKAWAPFGRLTVATPLDEELSVEASGSFDLVEVDIACEDFDYRPLPHYASWREFAGALPNLRREINRLCAAADIVQCDYGGHPVSLGQLAWRAAKRQHKATIWLFDGADPFPRIHRGVAEEKETLKRSVKRQLATRFEAFCRKAIAESDLVFTHNAAVQQRFSEVWGSNGHAFDRSFVKQSFVLSEEEVSRRITRLLDDSQPLRLVTAGRQIAIKATDHVLQAMAMAIANGASLELDVIGEGEDLATYVELSKSLGLEDRVKFHGSVPYGEPLFGLLKQAHVMTVTNLTAEISRNVLLGMALGLPLISYENPGTDNLIRDHDAGMLVPRAQVDALADAFFTAWRGRSDLVGLLLNGVNLARATTLEATHDRRAQLAIDLLRVRETSSADGVQNGVALRT